MRSCNSVSKSVLAWLAALFCAQAFAQDVITYYHTDISGSPIAATDASGALIWREDFSPYGERLQNQAAANGHHVWFTGHHHEERSGLTYAGARHYDPMIGRFLSVDPAQMEPGNQFTFNRYAYANNNPYRYVDPTGEIPLDTIWDAGNVVYDIGKIAIGWAIGNQNWVISGSKDLLWDAGAMFVPYAPAGMQKIGGEIVEQVAKRGDEAADAAKSLGANPFKGKTAKEISEILENKGYVPKGPDPAAGRGTYVNEKTGRGYHIDARHPEPKGPHVGVHRPRDMRDKMNPRDYPTGKP